MIVLDDPANLPSSLIFSIRKIPNDLLDMERFLGAQIAGTNEPVSHDIEAILPWLADPAIPQMLGRATIDPGTGYQGRVWGERHVEAFANGRGDASDVREALAPLMPQAGEDRSTISNVFGNVSRIASS